MGRIVSCAYMCIYICVRLVGVWYILHDTTTEYTLLECIYSICASGWRKRPSVQVAMGETTTCVNGVSGWGNSLPPHLVGIANCCVCEVEYIYASLHLWCLLSKVLHLAMVVTGCNLQWWYNYDVIHVYDICVCFLLCSVVSFRSEGRSEGGSEYILGHNHSPLNFGLGCNEGRREGGEYNHFPLHFTLGYNNYRSKREQLYLRIDWLPYLLWPRL